MYREKLLKIAKALEEEEAELLLTSLKSSDVEGIGFIEHRDLCALVRPHSHSADCDCGADDASQKILDIIDGE